MTGNPLEGARTHVVQCETDVVVTVQAVIPGGPAPAYKIYGKANCIECGDWCWLGRGPFTMIMGREAAPMCEACSARVLRPENHIGSVGD